MEASLDWKVCGHTTPGPEIEPGLSGPHCGGSTVTLKPASRKLFFKTSLYFLM